jgi:hypothetical protein
MYVRLTVRPYNVENGADRRVYLVDQLPTADQDPNSEQGECQDFSGRKPGIPGPTVQWKCFQKSIKVNWRRTGTMPDDQV